MALPKPSQGESKAMFIARSIQDADMLSNFPVPAMRSAVTNTLWYGHQKNLKLTANGLKACSLYMCPKCHETYAHDTSSTTPGVCMVCNTAMQVLKDGEPNPQLKSNLSVCMSDLIRTETLEGKEYLVVPVVMMVEGVHNNLLYSGDELGMFPDAWNGKPVVVNHPVEGGSFVTANTPQREESMTIGELYNTRWEFPKLKSEAWIDPTKANKVDPAVMQILQQELHMEVSISAFTEDEMTEGDFGAEHYEGIVHNLRPDHLAFLPDQEGACNWTDGAGAPRANEEEEKRKEKEDGTMKQKSGGQVALLAWHAVRSATDALKHNELSHDDIRSALGTVLRASLNIADNDYVYIRDVYDKYVVYEFATAGGDFKLYKQGYAVDAKDQASLVGDKVEVKVIMEYVPVGEVTSAKKKDDNAQKGNQKNEGSKSMDRKEQVDGLIACGAWAETDREYLTAMEDAQFTKLHAMKKDEPKVDEAAEPKDNKEQTNDEAPAVPADAVPKTVEDYIKGAPQEIAEVLSSSVALHKEQKVALIAELTGNTRCKFTEAALQAKTIGELKDLCALADIPVDFSARGVQDAPKGNANEYEAEAMPAMDFTKKA